jgi:CDP-2,3-bis-(O-geranylgeranyl)-sn-glycerol synthase
MSFLPLIWTYLPAFVANAVPVLLPHVPVLRQWNQPIAERSLGKNKTWRGFIIGTVFAVLIAWLQYESGEFGLFSGWRLFKGDLYESLLSGFLMGFGALTGDSVKSFFKRRMGIAPGKAWPVIDGIDYMIGAIIFLTPLFLPSFGGVIFLVLVGPIASLLANMVSYTVGWKSVWW